MKSCKVVKALTAFAVWSLLVNSGLAATTAEYEACLVEQISTANNNETVAVLRQRCAHLEPAKVIEQKPRQGLIRRRLALEREASDNLFALIQHKNSYILPATFNNRVNNAPFQEISPDASLDDVELKFQFSFKAELLDSIINERGRLFIAYTNKSFWQVFDEANSGPFRETNHEPEIFMDFDQNWRIGGWDIPLMRFGWLHQSNGRSTALSRSWNRIFGQLFFEKDNWALSLKPWIRVDGDSGDEDNPDIEAFLGNFELGILRQGNTSTTSVLLRNNLRSENRSGVEVNWSTKLYKDSKIRLFAQYFYGYGESLIDYNAKTERFGIGLQLSDFL